MAEKVKKHKGIFFALGIGLVLTIVGMLGISGMIALPSFVSAQVERDVQVTATIEGWLTFTVSPTSTELLPYMVTVGGETNIASSTDISLELGTNHPDGWNIQIKGANAGLLHIDGLTLIASVGTGATTTLSAGMDPGRYGANASSTITNATVGNYYNYWGTDTVGAIASTTAQLLASKESSNDAVEVAKLKIKAAAPVTQKIGTYNDTVTLTATGGS